MIALRSAALVVCACLLSASPLVADPSATALDEAVDAMLSVRESPEKLDQAIEAARKLGAGDQAVLEARFLFHVDRHEDGKLADLLPEMIEQSERFELADSRIFAVEEDWQAVVEYVKSIAALEKGDRAAFKKHITEAFWLSPRQGAAFAPHIERLRLADAMKKVRIDGTLELRDLGDRTTTLDALRGKAPALLLHFFSPWSRECEESIGDLRAVTAELAEHGLPVVGIVGEGDEETVAETRGMLGALDKPAPGTWVVDHPEEPLARSLRIQSAPTMILVDEEGRVLFNGHPSEEGLWDELSKIAPGCSRPAIGGDGH